MPVFLEKFALQVISLKKQHNSSILELGNWRSRTQLDRDFFIFQTRFIQSDDRWLVKLWARARTESSIDTLFMQPLHSRRIHCVRIPDKKPFFSKDHTGARLLEFARRMRTRVRVADNWHPFPVPPATQRSCRYARKGKGGTCPHRVPRLHTRTSRRACVPPGDVFPVHKT